jgi:hypothetical protein
MASDLLRMRLLDGRANRDGMDEGIRARQVRGEERLPGVVNTLISNDPKQWHVGAETYSRDGLGLRCRAGGWS